ncbi:GyrI-like domain-containing protein [Mariprofundus micogutta]|uniref:GyrI-like domain-containing protein n=1 Tax=Mariprofundus micogutta TaxID=1921010 RepID=UPI001559483A|nr:GyrI-like domain-containing protein [Mariprofundus micogutta]
MALFGLLTALGGGAVVMLYLGAFDDPQVTRQTTESYRIAYIENKGSYSNIEPVFNQVAEHLKKAEIEPGTACALYLNSVSEVAEEDRISRIGYIVGRTDYIPSPLEELVIPSREVAIATFEGGTLLGSHKAYKAMRDWSRANGYQLSLPALEIYHKNGVVEYQLPIHKQY